MSEYYIYLISSLTMLQLGMKPPFSFENFLQICQDKIPESDMDILKTLSPKGPQDHRQTIVHPTLKKWHALDAALRNELVRIRAARKHLDPAKYLRADGAAEPYIARAAMNAYRNPSALDAEKALDEERWRLLDELARGHYFDLDALIVYALKLLILERWERIRSADKARILAETLK